jgi:cell shape-determining protein MreC
MREFLKDLGLDQEQTDKIMAEFGKTITTYRDKVVEMQKQKKDYESQISELNAKLDENSKSLENLQNVTNENKELKTQIKMSNSKVKKEFEKFVTSEVMNSVDDEHDFESVLENYKKENPQYFGDTAVVKKVQSSPVLTGGTPQPQTTNDIMNNLIRGITD